MRRQVTAIDATGAASIILGLARLMPLGMFLFEGGLLTASREAVVQGFYWAMQACLVVVGILVLRRILSWPLLCGLIISGANMAYHLKGGISIDPLDGLLFIGFSYSIIQRRRQRPSDRHSG